MMFLEKIPCYLTTIVFRSLSLTLTISFLREYSPIPIIVLLVELVVVAAMWPPNTMGVLGSGMLVVTNAGSLNCYRSWDPFDHQPAEEDDEQDVAAFIKITGIVTTIHHFLVMITIITMGLVDPSLLRHWESPEFLLKPSGNDFYWPIIVTMVIGACNLILLIYRARNIAAIRK